MKKIIWGIISLLAGVSLAFAGDKIDLSGQWHYQLLGAPSSIPGEGVITLPNTLDNAHKSVYTPEGDNTSQLRREFSFVGEATYSKKIEVPKEWEDKAIFLTIERSKPSGVAIDGKEIGINSRISSSQIYELTDYLAPGSHQIEIKVNNADSIPPIVARSSHAVSESTQTNWNGILGEITLEAKNPFHIKALLVKEDEEKQGAYLTVKFSKRSPSDMKLVMPWKPGTTLTKLVSRGDSIATLFLPLSPEDLWSGENPRLHELTFSLMDKGKNLDTFKIITGFRNFTTEEKRFLINGKPLFLRGNVNAAVFPSTAYAPLDLENWKEYFTLMKDYRINHVRFHSWTPPEAAFAAADEAGIYLMVELPIWGELDRDLKFHNRFLKEELIGMMESYAHHPSFVMFSPGNELWGDVSLMKEYTEAARELNPRILATYGSNLYLGMNGQIGGEDFLVSSKVGDDITKSVRGSVSFADSPTGGHFNSVSPESTSNFSDILEEITVPVVSHEVGQYQTYPDFSEIEKYNGILKPDNLKEFKRRAEEAGTYRKNKEFAQASGEWASRLYKAEMELAMRSNGIAGFELFGLQDYPGQGTALVGIMDPFMESKGFITPEKWRQSASATVLLAELPKFVFTGGEKVEIPLLLADYSESGTGVTKVEWETPFDKGSFNVSPEIGLTSVGKVQLMIPETKEPDKMSLILSADHGKIRNEYDFWVFPEETPKIGNVSVTDNLGDALELLKKGGKVILCPDTTTISEASLEPLFITDFWNYRMFRTICDEMHLTPSPGTLGLLIEETHPALKKFPTDSHTDWQWFNIVSNSRPLIIDRLPKDFDPIVEVIDNVERNYRLALALECNVGKGKLIILSADLNKLEEQPEGKWLLHSLKEYLAGKDSKPKVTLTLDQLVNLLTKPSNSRLIKQLKNETYQRF